MIGLRLTSRKKEHILSHCRIATAPTPPPQENTMTRNKKLQVNDPDIDDKAMDLTLRKPDDRWDPGATVSFPPQVLDGIPPGFTVPLHAGVKDW